MKLLLTSAGIKNTSIHDELVDLLGKPIAESTALCIPSAIYAFPGGAIGAWKLLTGRAVTPLCELGWKSVGVLELTALPTIEQTHWTTAVEEADALLVGGGDPWYLSYWIEQSGLAGLFPSLSETVWVGVSAGSLVMGPCVGDEFVSWTPPTGEDRTLGLVDFAIRPHLDHEAMPDFSMANAERWAARLPVPGYALDDESAISIVDGTVKVVSEGRWKLFSRQSASSGRGSAASAT